MLRTAVVVCCRTATCFHFQLKQLEPPAYRLPVRPSLVTSPSAPQNRCQLRPDHTLAQISSTPFLSSARGRSRLPLEDVSNLIIDLGPYMAAACESALQFFAS